MATVERVTITPQGSNSTITKLFKECWIDSSIFGFRSAIKKFGVDRYKKNCGPATEGFNMVLNSHADGSRPFNGSGEEVMSSHQIAVSSPGKMGGDGSLPLNVDYVVAPTSVASMKVALDQSCDKM